jgi:hypothetical protein
MLVEVCFLVLCDFPLGNITFLTALEVPFVPQPAGSAASFGMPNHKCFVTVSRDLCKRSLHNEGFNPVQQTAPGGPQFDLFDQYEKIDLFTDVFVFNLFGDHPVFLSTDLHSLNTKISSWRGARELHPAS